MTKKFKALWAGSPGNDTDQFKDMACEVRSTTIDELGPGEVIVRGQHSGINYKDALAVTGQGKILRQLPLIPGIDVSGEVIESKNPRFKVGDPVLVNGSNLGEKICGGFSEYLRLPADILIPRPSGLSSAEAMILGTAGFTAALAIHQLELNGLRPEKGLVLVTGASGGVGSLAVSLLNQLGYETEAWTRRAEQVPWLEQCGAEKVTVVRDQDFQTRALESVVWSAAIDNVGGEQLQSILPRVDLWGSVASVGMAQSAKLETSVFPFILRGVNILGVSSNNCPLGLRKQLWEKMATTMKPKNLDHILSKTVGLEEVPSEAVRIVKGDHRGRIVVEL